MKEKLEDVLHTISFSAPIYCEEIEGRIFVRKKNRYESFIVNPLMYNFMRNKSSEEKVG